MNIQRDLCRRRLQLEQQLMLVSRILESIPARPEAHKKPGASGVDKYRSRSIFAVREAPVPVQKAPASPKAARALLERIAEDLTRQIAAIDRFLGG